jgi:glucosylglycerol-phosphate synthase
MQKMYQTVTQYDVKQWADHVFEMFERTKQETAKKPEVVTA